MTLPDSIRVLERGWLSSNNIVFLDDDGASVVDTGYVTHIDDTIRLIDEAREGRPLVRIVNTHIHSDHAGGNAQLKVLHGCEVWIPPGEAELVDSWDEERLSYRRTSQQCPRFSYDRLIHPHETLHLGGEDWTVLPAAGHDHAMVMLWSERLGILLSADALWQKGFGVIFPELAGIPGFAQQKATLDLIGTLKPRLVIPGHGAPFTDVAASLQAAHSRIDWFMAEPRRNSDNALKVLLAFKLLEARRLTLADLTDMVRASIEGNVAMQAHYPHDPEAMAAFMAQELVRAGAATRDGDAVVATR
ncbi:MAG TPA: MBL fold metallo-hydrolase [Aquabacterium sp.]|uniref:MBL fold metallo-hydrolase n=1 Tax=Aquabacterium sp. TaxID=1872578 RepID=UPI002E2F08EF|nr:MBL fold metallo-hydrolase [Aquabacterium sp.]HEX5357333.1 MBL fold metallo-hydrolase [Aquabacterium sp.]